VFEWNLLGLVEVRDLFADEGGFFAVVGHFDHPDRFTHTGVAPEFLGTPAGVPFDDGVGGGEDVAGATVILLELEDAGAGEMAFELEDIGDLGTSPTVDALVVVADGANVAAVAGEEGHQFELEGVGILEFVDEEVTVAVLEQFAFGGEFAEEACGEQEEIVEVNGVEILEFGFVTGIDGAEKRGLVDVRGAAAVLGLADDGARHVRLELFVFGGGAGDDPFDEPHRLPFVEDGEVLFVAELLDPDPENTDAERVEGAKRHFASLIRLIHRRQPLPHLVGSFVGEGDPQDMLRLHPIVEKADNAGGDDPGFTGAGSGEDQERTFTVEDGLLLDRVEVEEANSHLQKKSPPIQGGLFRGLKDWG